MIGADEQGSGVNAMPKLLTILGIHAEILMEGPAQVFGTPVGCCGGEEQLLVAPSYPTAGLDALIVGRAWVFEDVGVDAQRRCRPLLVYQGLRVASPNPRLSG